MAHLYELPNSTAGMDNIIIEVINITPALSPMLLLFVFFTVTLGGIVRQTFKTGSADYPLWATIGAMSMFLVAMIMSITAGLIRLDWLVIVVVITIFCGVWLFLSRRGSEI
mgnify:CR=1 FL=1